MARAYVGVGGKARQWWGIKPGIKETINISAPYVTTNGYPEGYSWAETKNHVVMVVGSFRNTHYSASSGSTTHYSSYTDGAVLSIDKQTGTAAHVGAYKTVGVTAIGAGSLGDGALFVGGDFKTAHDATIANYRRYYNSSLTFTEFSSSAVASINALVLKFANNTAAIVFPYSISSNRREPLVEVRDTQGTLTYSMIITQSLFDNYTRAPEVNVAKTFRGDQKALLSFYYLRGDNTVPNQYYDSIGYAIMDQSITYSVVMKSKVPEYGTKLALKDSLLSPKFTQRSSDRLGDNLICTWAGTEPIYTDFSTYESRLYYALFTPTGTYSLNYLINSGGTSYGNEYTDVGYVNYPYSICFILDSDSMSNRYYNKGYAIDMSGIFSDFSALTTLYLQSGGYYSRPDEWPWTNSVRIRRPTFISTDNGVFMHYSGTKNVFHIAST